MAKLKVKLQQLVLVKFVLILFLKSFAILYYQFDPTTPLEVLEALNSLPSSKSSPLDVIPVFKSCAPFFAPLISQLANISFSESIFPDTFKLVPVTRLLKDVKLESNDPSSL